MRRARRRPARLAIDRAVCEQLDFDEGLCQMAQHLLALEPMVTGRWHEFGPVPQGRAAVTGPGAARAIAYGFCGVRYDSGQRRLA